MAHFNKIRLRHLVEQYDKQTSRYQSYCELSNIILTICVSLPISKFKPIKSYLLAADKVYLLTEQKYIFEKLQAVSIGSTNIYCQISGTISQESMMGYSWLIFQTERQNKQTLFGICDTIFFFSSCSGYLSYFVRTLINKLYLNISNFRYHFHQNSHQQSPYEHRSHRVFFFYKELFKSFFHRLSRTTCDSHSILDTVAECRPFHFIFNFQNNLKSL